MIHHFEIVRCGKNRRKGSEFPSFLVFFECEGGKGLAAVYLRLLVCFVGEGRQKNVSWHETKKAFLCWCGSAGGKVKVEVQ